MPDISLNGLDELRDAFIERTGVEPDVLFLDEEASEKLSELLCPHLHNRFKLSIFMGAEIRTQPGPPRFDCEDAAETKGCGCGHCIACTGGQLEIDAQRRLLGL